jgi:hypothetical protein
LFGIKTNGAFWNKAIMNLRGPFTRTISATFLGVRNGAIWYRMAAEMAKITLVTKW